MPHSQLKGNDMERRYVRGVKVRADGGKQVIEGYAAVFNEQYDSGYFVETVKPGAFQRALKEKDDVRALVNHDPNNLIGRTKAGTLRMKEDSQGLHFEVDLPDTQVGRDLATSIERGDMDGCSFGFKVEKQSWRDEEKDGQTIRFRDIEGVKLYDVGPVTYPAYDGTSVGMTRSLFPEGVPEEVRSHVPELRDMKLIDAQVKGSPSDPGDGNADPDQDGDDDTIPALDTDKADDASACQCGCRACYAGECEDCEDYMAECGDPDNCTGDMRSAQDYVARDGKKTKRVAGEDLPASAFAYVGDPDKTETWKFPIKFSSDEKTKSHIRNALARFSQGKGVPDSVLAKIKAAAKAHGIHVGDEEKKSDTIALELAKAKTETLRASLSQ